MGEALLELLIQITGEGLLEFLNWKCGLAATLVLLGVVAATVWYFTGI